MTQSVFISGATSGIGLTTAQLLDEQGWRVFAAALPNDDFSLLVNNTSERLVTLQLDITDADAITKVVQTIKEHVGNDGLQAIINNAGIQLVGALETLSANDLRQQFEVNVFGHFQVIQAMLPLLRQTRGRIINISSLMGKVAMPILGAYSMSKHALEGMSDALRLELALFGIDVILIEFGAIDTPMTNGMKVLLDNQFNSLSSEVQANYQSLYNAMTETLVQQAKNATSPEKIAEVIIHALTTNKPKPRYAISPAVKGLMMMRQFAPDEIGDSILKRALKLP